MCHDTSLLQCKMRSPALGKSVLHPSSPPTDTFLPPTHTHTPTPPIYTHRHTHSHSRLALAAVEGWSRPHP